MGKFLRILAFILATIADRFKTKKKSIWDL